MSCTRFASVLETLIEFLIPFCSEESARARWTGQFGSSNGQLEEDINTLWDGLSLKTFLEDFGHLMAPSDRQVVSRLISSFGRFVSATPQQNIALDFFHTATWLDLQKSIISSLPVLERLKADSKS